MLAACCIYFLSEILSRSNSSEYNNLRNKSFCEKRDFNQNIFSNFPSSVR